MTHDIIIQAAGTCSVTLSDPMLALAWVKTVIGQITPDDYMAIFKALHPRNMDAAVAAQHIVDLCLGAPT
jgi:hypothetical protein